MIFDPKLIRTRQWHVFYTTRSELHQTTLFPSNCSDDNRLQLLAAGAADLSPRAKVHDCLSVAIVLNVSS